tara:strand:- start:504 stop:1106 length:603 start_codon:yes stop_codon:yes gene_type:complete
MNKEKLKKIIKQVIHENRQKSVLLEEPVISEDRQPKYEKLMGILQGDSDIKTVGIMSGQNPMATAPDPRFNVLLDRKFKKRLDQLGLKSMAIGGIFGGLTEKSRVILNVSEEQMDQLNREFKQWGFVFGKKIAIKPGESFMAFTMYEIDYDNDMGYRKDPYSKETGFVIKDTELKGVDDNVSFDPTSGKKFGLELYPKED